MAKAKSKKTMSTRSGGGVNFLMTRHMTVEGRKALNDYGLDYTDTKFKLKMKDPTFTEALKDNIVLRNATNLMYEWHFVKKHKYDMETALWSTPGIDEIGIQALWALGITSPEEAKKQFIKATERKSDEDPDVQDPQYLVNEVRQLFCDVNLIMDLSPEDQRKVWVAIMMALAYWGSITNPEDVVGPPTIGMKP